GVTVAHVEGLHALPLGMKRMMHSDRLSGSQLGQGGTAAVSLRGVEERSVALELDELDLAGRLGQGLEQPPDYLLGMGQTQPVQPHESGVAADIADEEERLSRPATHGCLRLRSSAARDVTPTTSSLAHPNPLV